MAAVPVLHADATRPGRIALRPGRAAGPGRGLSPLDSQLGLGGQSADETLGGRAVDPLRGERRSTPPKTGGSRRRHDEHQPPVKPDKGAPTNGPQRAPTEGRSVGRSVPGDEPRRRYKLTLPSVLKPLTYRLLTRESQT